MPEADLFGFVGYALEGRYRVDEAIGQGGFGVVYRGWHLTFEEPVAIKCLKIPAHFTEEARRTFEQHFRDEGKLLRKLAERHPAVVRAHDVSVLESHGVPYLVLEWLDGQTLDRALAERVARGRGPYSEQEAVALLGPVMEALALAHQGAAGRAIAHRDIKPENLFVLRSGGIKILDFGIAKAMEDGEQLTQMHSRTSSGFSAFSPQHGAPEQFRPRKFGESGPWTDVHALGLVLSELVSGRPALGQGDFGDLSEAATSPERPTPQRLGARVSDGFEAVCARALALQRQDRFAHAGELLAALQNLPQSRSAPGTRLPVATFLPGSAPPVPSPSPRPSSPAVSSAEVSTRLPELEAFQPTPGPASAPAPSPGAPVRALLWGGAGLGMLGLGFALLRALAPAPEPSGQPLREAESVPSPAVATSARATASQPPAAATESPPAAASSTSSVVAPPGMVLIRAGTFRMGAEGEGRTERPVHEVRISRDFFLDSTEVTVDSYLGCERAGKCSRSSVHGGAVSPEESEKYGKWCNEGRPERAQHPINCIDREQAAAYCKWAGKRLPTEAEWEYAARGAEGRLYPWGTEPPSCSLANVSAASGRLCGSSGGTRTVGAYKAGATPEGVFDLSGNVWEWVEDGWDPNAYPSTLRVDPVIPARGPQGALRGGSWDFIATSAKTVTRQPFDRDKGHVSTGVRCAKDAGLALLWEWFLFRLRAKRGAKCTAIVIGNKLLVSAYHILQMGQPYTELGGTYLDQQDTPKTADKLAQRLERLEFKVAPEPKGA